MVTSAAFSFSSSLSSVLNLSSFRYTMCTSTPCVLLTNLFSTAAPITPVAPVTSTRCGVVRCEVGDFGAVSKFACLSATMPLRDLLMTWNGCEEVCFGLLCSSPVSAMFLSFSFLFLILLRWLSPLSPLPFLRSLQISKTR